MYRPRSAQSSWNPLGLSACTTSVHRVCSIARQAASLRCSSTAGPGLRGDKSRRVAPTNDLHRKMYQTSLNFPRTKPEMLHEHAYSLRGNTVHEAPDSRSRCLLRDPCTLFNNDHGVNLSDTATILAEAYRHCQQLGRGGHAKAAAGSTDLRVEVYRRVTRDANFLDCMVAAAYRPRDSPHWKQPDSHTCQACSVMCHGQHTKTGRDWSQYLDSALKAERPSSS